MLVGQQGNQIDGIQTCRGSRPRACRHQAPLFLSLEYSSAPGAQREHPPLEGWRWGPRERWKRKEWLCRNTVASTVGPGDLDDKWHLACRFFPHTHRRGRMRMHASSKGTTGLDGGEQVPVPAWVTQSRSHEHRPPCLTLHSISAWDGAVNKRS